MAIIPARHPAAPPRSNGPLHASRVKQYLEDTMQAMNESYTFSATSIHRKSMIRSLLGCPKVELDAFLNELEEAQKWNATTQFIRENISALQSLPVADDAAETFQEGLVSFADFEERGANKLFNFMARGRSYQGKFERLLQDAAPDKTEWLVFYETQIQSSLSETERLELLLDADLTKFSGRSNNRRLDDANELKRYLDKCIHQPLGRPAYQQPADGGKARGEASEYDLLSYLNQVLIPSEYPGCRVLDENAINDDQQGQFIQVRSSVMIQNRRKDRNPNYTKKLRSCIIELPEDVNLHGVTNELDALVVRIEGNAQTVQILQVWEAKAALNPITIGDALQKKTQIVQEIVQRADDSSMILVDGRSFHLAPTFHSNPSIGIFGKTLASPASASRRVQTTIGEYLLENDALVVQRILDGDEQVPIPPETVKHRLSALLDLADKWDPTLVVSSDDFTKGPSTRGTSPKNWLSLFIVMFFGFILQGSSSEAIKFQPVPRNLMASVFKRHQSWTLDQVEHDKRRRHRLNLLSFSFTKFWSRLHQQQQVHPQGIRLGDSSQYEVFLDSSIPFVRGGARNGSSSPSRLFQTARSEENEDSSSEPQNNRHPNSQPNTGNQNNASQNAMHSQSRQIFTLDPIPRRRQNFGSNRRTYRVTVCQDQGKRKYMEDSVLVGNDCLAVFDGHGGKKVSQYLKLNLLAEIQLAKMVFGKSNESPSNNKEYDSSSDNSDSIRDDPKPSPVSSTLAMSTKDYMEVLAMSLDKLDQDVQRISHWSFQGSTAVVLLLHETKRPLPFFASLEESPTTTVSKTSKSKASKPQLRPMPQGPPSLDQTLIVANIGDSRAILSRQGRPVPLSRDHKPDDPEEKAHIEALGGQVTVRGTIARVNGNLSLSRAIGDKAERPFVRATPEFTTIPIQKDDDFVVVATDGLWDVFNNWEVVDFILKRSNARKVSNNGARAQADGDRENEITRALVQEALDRGSNDNISVIILWLN